MELALQENLYILLRLARLPLLLASKSEVSIDATRIHIRDHRADLDGGRNGGDGPCSGSESRIYGTMIDDRVRNGTSNPHPNRSRESFRLCEVQKTTETVPRLGTMITASREVGLVVVHLVYRKVSL